MRTRSNNSPSTTGSFVLFERRVILAKAKETQRQRVFLTVLVHLRNRTVWILLLPFSPFCGKWMGSVCLNVTLFLPVPCGFPTTWAERPQHLEGEPCTDEGERSRSIAPHAHWLMVFWSPCSPLHRVSSAYFCFKIRKQTSQRLLSSAHRAIVPTMAKHSFEAGLFRLYHPQQTGSMKIYVKKTSTLGKKRGILSALRCKYFPWRLFSRAIASIFLTTSTRLSLKAHNKGRGVQLFLSLVLFWLIDSAYYFCSGSL